MRYILFLFIASIASDAIGQENRALMEMVNAEKSFAAYAKSGGIAEAFMKFLDDSALVFERGEIVNGKSVWGSRKTDSAELLWYPEFAEVAMSGNFGYTTGPSQFRVKKGSAEPDYRGYFSSIWQKNNSGEWKVMLDIGCPSPSEYDESKVEYNSQAAKKQKAGSANIRLVEETFIANYNNGKGYEKYGSIKARYYRPAQKMATGRFVSQNDERVEYKNAGTGVAPSADFGYAYGYVAVGDKKGNYLRVWKKENEDWRIVLDVANY
ncbi:MAG: nuclear transport factor 2 family protein [Chitinophagaceae bacterium]|nr:nuclear transport factor 2 family protein [Chitinophagaceae bacterium]